jgi:hypothetical protein
VIPVRDLRLLERLIEEAEDRIDIAEAEEPASIPWKDVRRDLLEGTAVRVEIKPSAVRALQRLHAPVRAKLTAIIDALADEPQPAGCKKLAGSAKLFRVRAARHLPWAVAGWNRRCRAPHPPPGVPREHGHGKGCLVLAADARDRGRPARLARTVSIVFRPPFTECLVRIAGRAERQARQPRAA